jgi:FdhE protein
VIDWQRRADRAEALAALLPAAAQALRFLAALTRAQGEIYQHIAPRVPPGPAPAEFLLPHAAPLVERVAAASPPALAAAGRALSQAEWASLLAAEQADKVTGRDRAGALSPASFWARALLHPFWAAAAVQLQGEAHDGEGRCWGCDAAPLCGVLREDREAGAAIRWLCCGRCGSQWRYRRVSCPACGEEDPERLPRYSAEEIPWVRLEACDACHLYLKVIDLDRAQDAEPVADELGALALDLFAAEQGYRKISPNLIGV